MGIGRLLIIAAVVWLAIRWYRGYRRQQSAKPGQLQGKLVRCARCGVYLPLNETRPDRDNAPICVHHHSDG